jgi:hypothetical protein
VTTPAVVDLAHRYGHAPRSRKPLVVAAACVLAVVGLGWLAWTISFHGRPLVRSELVSYDVASTHSAKAELTVVRRNDGVRATCLVRALAADHSIVGETTVTVPANAPTTTTLTSTLRTEREATSVLLLGCSAPGQTARR